MLPTYIIYLVYASTLTAALTTTAYSVWRWFPKRFQRRRPAILNIFSLVCFAAALIGPGWQTVQLFLSGENGFSSALDAGALQYFAATLVAAFAFMGFGAKTTHQHTQHIVQSIYKSGEAKTAEPAPIESKIESACVGGLVPIPVQGVLYFDATQLYETTMLGHGVKVEATFQPSQPPTPQASTPKKKEKPKISWRL